MSEFDTQENLLSLHFGRTFWLDDKDELCSAPTFKNGKTDWERYDYVSDWSDLEGVDLERLLDVHKTLIISRYTRLTIEGYSQKVYQGAQPVKCNPIEHTNKMEKLTHSKIIGMSDAELKDYIKQGFADVTEHDMIDKELYYRDQRRILID